MIRISDPPLSRHRKSRFPLFAGRPSEVFKGANRNGISTASLPKKPHDKGYYDKGVFWGTVAELHPLKQGLKLIFDASSAVVNCLVAELHPLKQGLKQIMCAWYDSADAVAELHPLKQGLKQDYLLAMMLDHPRCRATSTKTRIETLQLPIRLLVLI